jgi:23S rRNA (guanosine2251-2'-O)-methyltransferase
MRKLKLDELNRLSAEQFEALPKHPLVLVLDNIRSLANVGSAFRTGDAFAVEKIYLCGITGRPPHREIHKSALGAQDTVPWEGAEDAAILCRQLQERGYRVMAVEQAEGSTPLQDFVPKAGEKWALVFGNEVEGVSDGVMQLADAALEIPQWGTKHSLNVSVSMGIVLWSLLEKLHR